MIVTLPRISTRIDPSLTRLSIALVTSLFIASCASNKTTLKTTPSAPEPELTYADRPAPRQQQHRAYSDLQYMPVKGVTQKQIANNFGAPRGGGTRTHKGIDIFAPSGRELLAVTSGRVERTYNNLGGNSIYLRGDNGLTYYYAHLSRYHKNANDGDRVQGGQVIGYVGNSGNAKNTPAHLHFEIRQNGQTINPYYTLRDPEMIVTPIGASTPVEYADYDPADRPNITGPSTRPAPARNSGGEARRSSGSAATKSVQKAKTQYAKRKSVKPKSKHHASKQLAAKKAKATRKQAVAAKKAANKKKQMAKKAAASKKKYTAKGSGRGHGARG